MKMKTVTVFGAGGHARVVIDAWRTTGGEVDRCIIDGPDALPADIGGVRAQRFDWSEPVPSPVHVAIGENGTRSRISERLIAAGATIVSIHHQTAVIARDSRIGSGGFVAAGAVLGPGAELAEGVIANHCCIIDHNCRVGAWSHVAPNATLGGDVQIGRLCLIGAAAVILPGVSVGDGATVGAGAVVITDIAPGLVVAGVPARPLARR